ncbi:hypothetical protein BKA70DRAFT_1330928 [Coprinopsis sp. MPI-PUGE-AT-0042]|nr:hypothetical protein BKA70DRAFT_1330928 [Coprinopsis sp. MPI-PUGE-AT-0042]
MKGSSLPLFELSLLPLRMLGFPLQPTSRKQSIVMSTISPTSEELNLEFVAMARAVGSTGAAGLRSWRQCYIVTLE